MSNNIYGKKLQVTFLLPSGLECTATELYGEHQGILTKSGTPEGEKFNNFLKAILVKIGSHTKPFSTEFIEAIPTHDKRKILGEVRCSTFDYEPSFNFTYEYVEQATKLSKETKLTAELVDEGDLAILVEELAKEFGDTAKDRAFYRELNKVGTFKTRPYRNRLEKNGSYDNFKNKIEVELPVADILATIGLSNGTVENRASATNKADINTNTLLSIRNPTYQHIKEGKDKETTIQLDMARLHAKDLKALRLALKYNEGAVGTEILFENPDTTSTEKNITIDVLQQIAFFYPSESLK